jgi:hypothetical protein
LTNQQLARKAKVTRSKSEFQGTVLWSALEGISAELEASGEIAVNTAPANVITHMCRELVSKKGRY